MSRSIDAELENAQRSDVREYGWRVVVGDCPCEAPRFDWIGVQSGPSADNCAATLFPNGQPGGHIYRARVDLGNVSIQRVTDPTSDALWNAAWTWNLGQVARDFSPVALGYLDCLLTGLTAYVFYLARASGDIVCRHLVNDVWSAEQTVYSRGAAETVRGLAMDGADGNGRWLVATLARGAGGDEDPMVVEYQRATDSWLPANKLNWGHHNIGHCAVVSQGEKLHIWFTAGIDSSHLYYTTWRVSDAIWSATAIISEGQNGFWHYHPTAIYDEVLGRWLLMWREYCANPTRNEHVICHTPLPDHITERMPSPATASDALQLVQSGDNWYLIGSGSVWRGRRWTGDASQKVDLSARLVSLEEEYGVPNRPGKLTLLLQNHDGALAEAGVQGAVYEPLRVGAQLGIALGCKIGALLSAPWRSPWYIESLVFEEGDGAALLRVECTDPLGLLHGLRSRGQPSWAGLTARSVLRRVLCRVTARELNIAGALETSLGWLTLNPGSDWGEFAAEVAQWTGVVLRWRTREDVPTVADGVGPGVVDVNAVGLSEGTVARSFGGEGEASILRASFGVVSALEVNRVQVYGAGNHYGQASDEAQRLAESRDLTRIVHDKKLTSDADCATVAAQHLRWARLASREGWVEIYPDFALEIGDVIAITHPRAGLENAAFRIVGMRTVFDTRRGQYSQRLRLGYAQSSV